VRWARERPPGGGPVAGVAAGLGAVLAELPDLPWVVVLAGDQPFAAEGVPALLAARTDGADDADDADGAVDAVVGVDGEGRDQPLLAAYRPVALAAQLTGEVAGRSMRSLLAGLTVRRVVLPPRSCLDIDDAAALEQARAERARGGPAR
jgi:molybdopterin-guanine dinucleotide biosynthesis protein A